MLTEKKIQKGCRHHIWKLPERNFSLADYPLSVPSLFTCGEADRYSRGKLVLSFFLCFPEVLNPLTTKYCKMVTLTLLTLRWKFLIFSQRTNFSLIDGSPLSSHKKPISLKFLKKSSKILQNVSKILKNPPKIKFSISIYVSRSSIRSEPFSRRFCKVLLRIALRIATGI